MRAVVLVGGFGTRLRPLTLHTPKQMLPVVNRPMIERVIEHVARQGVTSAVLSLGYRPDAFQDAYPDGTCAGVPLHYAIEPEPLDTAGAIRFAALDAGIDERFLVLNGDILTDLDIAAVLDFHDKAGAEGTIVLHPVEDPSAYGVVPTEESGRVTAFIEKPPRDEAPTNLINAGTYVLEPSVLERIPAGERVNVERVTFPGMVADGSLFAIDGCTYWIDAGTPSTYLTANLDLLDGRRGTPERGVHPSAEVDGSVVDAVVGPGASVAEGAVVSGSVVFAGARIGAGALVEGAVIGARVEVGAGAVVDEGAIIGDDVVLPSGGAVHGGRVPEED
jgi:mannose-1-phosphate guanylyltransferase